MLIRPRPLFRAIVHRPHHLRCPRSSIPILSLRHGIRPQSTEASAAASVAPSYVDVLPSAVSPPPHTIAPSSPPKIRPEQIVAPELNHLRAQISLLLSSGYPGLDTTAKYYLKSTGKLFRPMVIFLMARATSSAPKNPGWQASCRSLEAVFNHCIAPEKLLADVNPDLASLSSKSMPANISGTEEGEIAVLGTQRRLAEIAELIHTASLLHDDVIDHAETRRGMPSANMFSGNKLSILAGDYMLGRASIYLARLRHPEVTELIAEVIAELVKGELFQLRNTGADYHDSADYLSKSLDYYLEKTYLKTASLVSKSCRAAALLGGATNEVADAAYSYGKHMGLAFQLIDDVLDYTGSKEEIGKPAGADLELGLATAPVFYAWEEFPELGEMIQRQFKEEGDAVKARDLVFKSAGIEKTRKLAQQYCDTARAAIQPFPDSDAKAGLEAVLEMVLTRKK